eukprot:Colp12_sorted_trinity150504_noHs@31337
MALCFYTNQHCNLRLSDRFAQPGDMDETMARGDESGYESESVHDIEESELEEGEIRDDEAAIIPQYSHVIASEPLGSEAPSSSSGFSWDELSDEGLRIADDSDDDVTTSENANTPVTSPSPLIEEAEEGREEENKEEREQDGDENDEEERQEDEYQNENEQDQAGSANLVWNQPTWEQLCHWFYVEFPPILRAGEHQRFYKANLDHLKELAKVLPPANFILAVECFRNVCQAHRIREEESKFWKAVHFRHNLEACSKVQDGPLSGC